MADQAIEQISEYLSGVRTEFDVPIDLELPAFYQKVLLTVRKIRFELSIHTNGLLLLRQ